MGRIFGSWGVRGGVRVDPYSEDPETLATFKTWLVGREGDWKEYPVLEARLHTTQIVAQLAGVDDRDAALALKGSEVAVSRDALPQPEDGSYYWSDLVGLQVVGTRGELLGQVKEMFSNGAQDVIDVVDKEEVADAAGARRVEVRRLVPWTAVQRVDMAGGRIEVEWEKDW
ncbi:MAG: ribosome maturation factor RimM [Betaproteobacteria bacterium]